MKMERRDFVKAALAALPHQRDLSMTPVKAVVFRLADESVLGLSMHHIAFDGASCVPFVKSIESVLAGGEPLAQPADNALSAPPASAYCSSRTTPATRPTFTSTS